ncbi:MAG TPA: hypothetical protein DCQ97_12585 [Chitinophagaceae bacterium]|nr:hypothetical protein [Chitinophagaceae bacterium]
MAQVRQQQDNKKYQPGMGIFDDKIGIMNVQIKCTPANDQYFNNRQDKWYDQKPVLDPGK